ncbi:hypothetical protein FJZ23_02030, partial [Candidatus Parcubacteria bacterium]|nr:hypothetical protein [Candidatus Parcubacteria bacterium]
MIKTWIRRLVPESAISAYHLWLARAAAVAYGHPSEQLIVVGVTGTNGKSSTVQYIGRILEHAGFRAGWTTTVGFKVGPHEWVNDKKMTMLGRFATQRLLREMVRAGCTHAIIETSSQGILQHRHAGIHYDVAVFTNLTPEHIEAHGGFDRYKATKGRLFAELATAKEKVIDGRGVQKASVVNGLDEHAEYFLSFRAGVPFVFGKNAKDVRITKDGTVFTLEGVPFSFKSLGRFNYENVLAAITTCRSLGMPLGEIAEAVAALEPVPGRLEVMDVGQSFAVVVDYAYEPASLAAVYEAIKLFGYARLIHVTGSAGGGRDVARRAIIGQMAAEHDD